MGFYVHVIIQPQHYIRGQLVFNNKVDDAFIARDWELYIGI